MLLIITFRKIQLSFFTIALNAMNIIVESLNYTIERALIKGFEFGEPLDCLQ